jgi:hypothetical protein
MALFKRKSLILAKLESTYGTDSSPAGANAVLVRGLEITPLTSDVVGRDLVRPYFGNSDQLLTKLGAAVKFQVELAGAGSAGNDPRYSPVLRACGMAITTVASTSVTYTPVSGSFDSVTIYANIDGILHKMPGCRGTFSIKCDNNQIPYLEFDMQAVYVEPTDVAAVTPSYGAQTDPLIFRQGNTSGFQICSYSGILSSFEFNLSNDVVYRDLVGSTREVLITDRKPTGSVMIQMPDTLASPGKNFFNLATTETNGNLTFLHGTTAGNRVQFTAGQVDLSAPAYEEQDGIVMLRLPYTAVPTNAGNNDFSLVYT